MMIAGVSLVATGIAAIASFVLGFVWFSLLFSRPYLVGLEKTADQLAQGPSTLASSMLQLLGNVVMASVLTWLLSLLGYHTAADGIKLGVLVWFGFIAAVIGPMYAFQAFSLQFFAITAGYPLVALVIMGAIIGSWKV